jgi:hypothetical protein
MTNIQLYFAIGVPTFSVLVGIVIGIFQQVHTLNQFNLRFTSLENRIGSVEGRMGSLENRLDSRMSTIEADIKTLVRILGDLDVRLARLEERTSR